MGSTVSKLTVKGNPENAVKVDDFCALKQRVDEWKVHCLELTKEPFIKLIPLTYIMGQYLVAAVMFTEIMFQIVSCILKAMAVVLSPDQSSSKRVAEVEFIGTVVVGLRQRFHKLQQSCENVRINCKADPATKIILDVQGTLQFQLIHRLLDWLVMALNKCRTIKERNLEPCKCCSEKLLKRTIKHLASAVNTYSEGMKKLLRFDRRLTATLCYFRWVHSISITLE